MSNVSIHRGFRNSLGTTLIVNQTRARHGRSLKKQCIILLYTDMYTILLFILPKYTLYCINDLNLIKLIFDFLCVLKS